MKPLEGTNLQPDYTVAEQMIVAASREIRDSDIIYTGVGLPNIAGLLAKLSHAPRATIVFETGIVRTTPCNLGLGVDSLHSHYMADMLTDVLWVNSFAQRGFFTIGFLGGGQVDRHGNVNSTCIGDYRNPTMRFPGAGGGCDIASLCKNVIILLEQKKPRFPERVDFISAPGYLDGKAGSREAIGLPPGTGPVKVITNLAVYSFCEREMVLESIHSQAGVTLEQIRANVGWDIRIGRDIKETKPPTGEELTLLRTKIDPEKRFIRGRNVL
jgi:glutaconate CoA-transferase, subunit B